MTVEEMVNRLDDFVAAVERLADALEAIRAIYDEMAGRERLDPIR